MARDYTSGVGGYRESPTYKEVACVNCGVSFKQRSYNQKFCCGKCKGKFKYSSNKVTTDSQYKSISGDWKRYFSRLIQLSGRKKDSLTVDIILNKLKEQDYKCALSGVPLTCILQRGVKYPTNASIDRIKAGEEYSEQNIQLVCTALNSWRADLPVDDFIHWCSLVVDFQKGKINGN